MAPKKVLCLYGSEGGQSKSALQGHVKKWTASSGGKFEIVKVDIGNSVANDESACTVCAPLQRHP